MEIQTGHISTFIPERSWGYIAQQVEGRTVKFFFHQTQYRAKTPPQVGVEVEFSVNPVREGKFPTALNVTPKQ
jgi:hypothetical protein